MARAFGSLVVVVGVALCAPGVAGASELKLIDQPPASSGLSYQAAPGEANRLTMQIAGDRYDVRDDGASIDAHSPCATDTTDAHHATCPLRDSILVSASLGDGDDDAQVTLPGAVAGDDGNDRVTGIGMLLGGEGDDVLTAGAVSSMMWGGPGNDRLTGSDAGTRDGCPAGYDGDDMDGGTGDDVLVGRAGRDGLTGGEGDDRLDGGAACDALFGDADWRPGPTPDAVAGGDDDVEGGAGNDEIWGGGGNDDVGGGPGDDTIAPGYGRDTVAGGEGFDKVDYGRRTEPLDVTLDGRRDDGAVGEDDLVGADVEGILGGDGPDRVVGNSSPNFLSGGGGDDLILAGGGLHDRLIGDAGGDTIYARDGGDEGAGRAPDGSATYDDQIVCEWGLDNPKDVAIVDHADTAGFGAPLGCGVVLFSLTPMRLDTGDVNVPVRAACPPPPAPDVCSGVAALEGLVPTLHPTRHGKVSLDRVRRWSRRLGRARFHARAGHRRRVRVKLSRSGRELVRKRGHVKVLVAFTYPRRHGR